MELSAVVLEFEFIGQEDLLRPVTHARDICVLDHNKSSRELKVEIIK